MKEEFVEISGSKVHYIFAGQGGSGNVILLHGMRFSSQTWQDIDALRKISQWGFNVFALDYPGFGKSEHNSVFDLSEGDYSVSSNFVKLFMEKVGIVSATLLGPSMGGAIALRSLMDLPDRVVEVIVLAPAGFESLRGDLYRIERPVHLVWGTEDNTVDISFGRKYHDLIGGSDLTLVKGGDHVIYLKKTSQFFSLIKKFLLHE